MNLPSGENSDCHTPARGSRRTSQGFSVLAAGMIHSPLPTTVAVM
jgi:hypothetical protein